MAFHRYSLVVAGLVGIVMASSQAWAGPPCAADIQKLCSNVPAGQGAIQACLKSHEADLSADCKKHVGDVRKRGQQLAARCVWDIERFCSETPPGGGRILACLQQNADDLSPECKAQIKQP